MKKQTSHVIRTDDGREIRINEAGRPEGLPVLALLGTPGSALLSDVWIQDAEARGIRLMSYDRPGYGGSTPRPGRTVASAVDDVATLAQALNIDRLLVWGHSGGGPHALACAALLPDLVVAAAALSSIAPYPADGLDWFAGMGQDNIEEFGAALEGREPLSEFIEKMTPGLLSATPLGVVETIRSLLCPADVEVLTGELAAYILATTREGIKDRRDGWVDDDLAFTSPWGFEPDRIRIPVMIMQGAQDQMVPLSHGEWLAGRIPRAEVRLLPDDGHLTISARRMPEVHAWLLSKMQ